LFSFLYSTECVIYSIEFIVFPIPQYRKYCFSSPQNVIQYVFFLLSTIRMCCFSSIKYRNSYFSSSQNLVGCFPLSTVLNAFFSFHTTYSVYICCFSSRYLSKYVALLLTMQNAVLIRIVHYGIKYALSNNWIHPLSRLSIYIPCCSLGNNLICAL
jgi:hypothetical protein